MPRKAKKDRPVWAKTISEARTRQHITQDKLGQSISRSTAIVKKYEAGSTVPPLTTLINIANVLSLNINTLAQQAGYSKKDLEQEARMYWVNWIAKDSNGKPYSLGINTPYRTEADARKEVEFQIKTQKENLVSIWIDKYNGDDLEEVIDLKVFVNAVGMYIE